jgi:type IV pilus assembly protein PilN
MITINLLPVRAARKKENVRRQVSVFFLGIIFTFCVIVYITISMNSKISEINRNIETTQAELKRYEAKAKEASKIRKELKKLEEKMDIIVKLEANRMGPVRFMAALTDLVIADKMWLTSLTESKGNMKLAGMATDNNTIADFMTNLEGSRYFSSVDLISSKQTKSGAKQTLKQFTITCRVSNEEPTKESKAS